ncbi:MAG: exopolyphosphatase [Burkholderiaceae bacterium]
MDIDKTPNTTGGLLAAVDLGSNSFRLLIGRVDQTEFGDQIRPLDALKEPVRLGAGLRPDGTLDKAAQQRGMQALARFGERLRHFAPETVRAVATNALRVASNANDFLMPAQEALGFPIEVISGREEARLIYLGAAHALPLDETDRLVIDIGGGSTELIIGANDQPKLVESAPIGCVSLSREFFPEGEITEEAIEHARLAARDAIAPYAVAYRRHGWQYAVGTSGTAKSLTQIAEMTIGDSALTRDSLEEIAHILTADGSTNSARIRGLSPDRRPVLPGGLALMLAVFDEFDVRSVRYCHGALRQGALYDLLGRSAGHDMRTITVAQMMERYAIDFQQARRLTQTAVGLLEQLDQTGAEEHLENRQLLTWATQLAEVGLSISHDAYHKHSAYILRNADMQGFSRPEQRVLSTLALGQTGGLRKLRDLVDNQTQWQMVLCLRIASIVHRRRDPEPRPMPALTQKENRIRISMPDSWVATHPLTHETLQTESQIWNDVSAFEAVEYRPG